MCIRDRANRDEMKLIYNDKFDEEAVRRVLSSITNKELLNGGSPEEKRFWNNNMWMMEDMGVVEAMVDPIKHLNLDDVETDKKELIFVPGHIEEHYDLGDKLVVNLFKVSVIKEDLPCLLYTSPSPRDGLLSRMPSSA